MEESFFERVYAVVKQIPAGRVTSYGAIANFLGAKGSSRMVGWAMNNASKMDDIPAHRVVNRNGLLTGKHHFPGTRVMEQMLEAEGIEVVEDKVVEFQNLYWDPTKNFSLFLYHFYRLSKLGNYFVILCFRLIFAFRMNLYKVPNHQ